MNGSFDTLKKVFRGDIDSSPKTLLSYSRDASLFEIKPLVVVFPKDSADVGTLVRWVNETNAAREAPGGSASSSQATPKLSITARSGGTDMSGGAIGASIICDFTRYMNAIGRVTVDGTTSAHATVQPGCFYRDFEKATLKYGMLMPTYPASREICAVGGMVANNSGGEKSLKYGKTANHIKQLKVVFNDGNEYTVKPLTEAKLREKMAETENAANATGKNGKNAGQPTFEASMYRSLFELITAHYDAIRAAKPNVSKNSAGYYLWDVYDKAAGTFDLCQLIVGSQGTLGLVTEITFSLVPAEKYSNMLVVFMPEISKIAQVVNEVLPFKPESIESYDDYSMELAVKFFFDFFKQLGFWGALRLGLQFIPDAWAVLASGKIPKLILMVEFAGDDEVEIRRRLIELKKHLTPFGYKIHITRNAAEAEKYWRIRRESFNLLRKHSKGKRTAPFIDDIVVRPEFLPEFMPKIQAIIKEYKLVATIAGHPGNGNFHIIPLMDLSSPFSADTILEVSHKVYDLVLEYHGSIDAEHNDGIIRTPYLKQMFGEHIVALFKQTKEIFDPLGIFNPGKKVGGTFEDIKKAVSRSIN